ncbi:hypothetical protein ETAA8_36480 [Anatilimnocola aggregata]|uniref:Uncharacterized protein n=1 Tax=Anatilimnocola aggregata TaxID=2528021 RepID=A0A517YEA1_9BACT|nr:hypothetical protein ETAA8_36480 [Anatilimnocola aggregata]
MGGIDERQSSANNDGLEDTDFPHIPLFVGILLQ